MYYPIELYVDMSNDKYNLYRAIISDPWNPENAYFGEHDTVVGAIDIAVNTYKDATDE